MYLRQSQKIESNILILSLLFCLKSLYWIFLHLVKRKFTPIIEQSLKENQASFRENMGARDGIVTLSMII